MLDFDPVWLPTMIVSFLAFMVIFNTVLIKPLLKVIDERDGRIQAALDEARVAEERFQEALGKIESELAGARREAKALIEKERQAGLQEQQKLLAEANLRAEEAAKQANRELRAAVETARASLKAQADALSADIAGKLVGSRS